MYYRKLFSDSAVVLVWYTLWCVIVYRCPEIESKLKWLNTLVEMLDKQVVSFDFVGRHEACECFAIVVLTATGMQNVKYEPT